MAKLFFVLVSSLMLTMGTLGVVLGVGYVPPLYGNFVIGVCCLCVWVQSIFWWRTL